MRIFLSLTLLLYIHDGSEASGPNGLINKRSRAGASPIFTWHACRHAMCHIHFSHVKGFICLHMFIFKWGATCDMPYWCESAFNLLFHFFWLNYNMNKNSTKYIFYCSVHSWFALLGNVIPSGNCNSLDAPTHSIYLACGSEIPFLDILINTRKDGTRASTSPWQVTRLSFR